MLKVKTYLDKSILIPQAGLGLFAEEDILSGTIIWVFENSLDLSFSKKTYDNFYGITKDFLDTYSYKESGEYILCSDNGRFINHSKKFCNTIDLPYKTIASRDIKKGEEIFSDYSKFSQDENDNKHNLNDIPESEL